MEVDVAVSAPAQTPELTSPLPTAREHAVMGDDFATFQAAKRAEAAGKPLPPPAPVDEKPDDDEAEPVAVAPPERQVSKRQQQINDYERRIAAQDAELTRLRTAAAPAAPRSDPKTTPPAVIATPDDPEPDPSDATLYPAGEYDPQYLKAVAKREARLEFRAEQARVEIARQKDQAAADELRAAQSFKTKVDAAITKHADFQAVALDAPTEIPPTSVVHGWILDSPHGAEVLYALQKDKAEQRRLLALPAYQQIRALVALEDSFAPPPLKTTTTAPEPIVALGTHTTEPGDALRSAVIGDDFAGFQRAKRERHAAQQTRR